MSNVSSLTLPTSVSKPPKESFASVLSHVSSATNAPRTAPPRRYMLGAYFAEWSIYARDYDVMDMPGESLTHVFYAFLKPNADGTVVTGDSWAFKEKQTGRWDDSKDKVYGNVEQIVKAKAKWPHLKIVASVGGWTWSNTFSAIAASPALRKTFASSCAKIVGDYGFDGIDIDWEYPESPGAGNPHTEADGENFCLLMTEIRAALRTLQIANKARKRYILSACVGWGKNVYEKLPLKEMAKTVDFFLCMAYDKEGAWSTVTGHQAPWDWIQEGIRAYRKAGVPGSKLFIGAPMYGRVFQNATKPNQPFQQPEMKPGQWERGIYDYKYLVDTLNVPELWDDAAKASYTTHAGDFISFDTTRAVKVKADAIRRQGLAGLFFWEISGDSRLPGKSLVQSAKEGLQLLDLTPNRRDFRTSPFVNVRALKEMG